ncbi:hypothetical protein AV530_010236 [Patagioenas fasciata monilis]|uniref:Uncharacterized protein n=1 Tax=Patagioenas fasciata monilis TaxID=372326 RepID=A0A1V4L0H1_PATFA|nr:hypothetical protein AV530_010236 [Patagioenas fasciata monilis]
MGHKAETGTANRHTTQRWVKKFLKGDKSLEDEEQSGGQWEVTMTNGQQPSKLSLLQLHEKLLKNHPTVIWHLKQIGKVKKFDKRVPQEQEELGCSTFWEPELEQEPEQALEEEQEWVLEQELEPEQEPERALEQESEQEQEPERALEQEPEPEQALELEQELERALVQKQPTDRSGDVEISLGLT